MQFQPGMAALERLLVLVFASAALAACSTMNLPDAPKTIGPAASPHYKIGAPYKIDGRWYTPKVDEHYDETGLASWYGDAFHNKLTANGEIFDKRRISAAHKTLPLPTLVEVENLENGRKIVVRVNDRGPFVGDRVIDLSHAAADELGFTAKGLAKVRVRYVGETDVTALAALPGDKATKPVKVAAKKEPARAAATPDISSGDDDPLATLIANATGGARPAMAATPASASAIVSAAPLTQEFWVEIAQIKNLDELAKMRLDLPELGPVSVQADQAGGIGQSLRIGPFLDEAIAALSLSRARAAGFGGARILRNSGT